MVQKRVKKLASLDKNTRIALEKIVRDIITGNIQYYDTKKLTGSPYYRIRKGNIRIIFDRNGKTGIIKKIDFRGDIYKKFGK